MMEPGPAKVVCVEQRIYRQPSSDKFQELIGHVPNTFMPSTKMKKTKFIQRTNYDIIVKQKGTYGDTAGTKDVDGARQMCAMQLVDIPAL